MSMFRVGVKPWIQSDDQNDDPKWCHFMTTFLCHFWGHFLDPHFGSFYGHHFGSYPIINLLSLNLGVLERVSHAKRCTEHTCLNMHQIWGSPRARPAYQFLTHFLGHVLDPHFGSSFWPHFMTTFLTIILGFIYRPIIDHPIHDQPHDTPFWV